MTPINPAEDRDRFRRQEHVLDPSVAQTAMALIDARTSVKKAMRLVIDNLDELRTDPELAPRATQLTFETQEIAEMLHHLIASGDPLLRNLLRGHLQERKY